MGCKCIDDSVATDEEVEVEVEISLELLSLA